MYKKTICSVLAVLFMLSFCEFVLCSPSSSYLKDGSLKQVGCLDFGIAYDVCVLGMTAYVTGNKGVQIVDVRNPESPKSLSEIRLGDGAFGVVVENGTAYIAGDKEGFFIADVRDPFHPALIGQYSEKKGVTVNVSINGNYAYVVMREGGLLVLDINDKKKPRLLQDIRVGERATEIFLHKNYLYVSDPSSGLVVFDVTDPASPVKLSIVPGTQGVFGIDIKGDLLFLGCHSQGLKILDASDPIAPQLIGTFRFSSEANYVISGEKYLYVADQNDGIVHVLDIRDPARPVSLARSEGYMPHRIFFGNEYLYVADGKFGLVIFQFGE